MENFYLAATVRETASELENRTLAKIALQGAEMFLDFRLPGERGLLISLDPASPALYLSGKNPKDNSSDPFATNQFFLLARKRLTGARLIEIAKDPSDRVVRLEFERFDVSGERLRSLLIASLTGRSTNAYLANSAGAVEARMADRGRIEPGDIFPPRPEGEAEPGLAMQVEEDASRDEILEMCFGPGSSFGPLLKREYLARCRTLSPARAFNSLLEDVSASTPTPLVYSAVPLGDFGTRIVNLSSDLLLAHFELASAEGMLRHQFATLSEAADSYYNARARARAFQEEMAGVKKTLADEIKKRRAIVEAIESDRKRFEDPERLKKRGDLLLANIATAEVKGSEARVVDYFDPEQPTVSIDIGDHGSLQQAAADYFSRYQKGRRALSAIQEREAEVRKTLVPLEEAARKLDGSPTAETVELVKNEVEQILGRKSRQAQPGETAARRSTRKAAGRRFLSTDGYEILVGRNDQDNDYLTFRVARPQDLWLHAADYPGSHVVVRNPKREPIPHRVIREAAGLAAFFSQARREGKAGVHYTEKKFVTKPPKAKPGLVRLSSFKTVIVEPKCELERIE